MTSTVQHVSDNCRLKGSVDGDVGGDGGDGGGGDGGGGDGGGGDGSDTAGGDTGGGVTGGKGLGATKATEMSSGRT